MKETKCPDSTSEVAPLWDKVNHAKEAHDVKERVVSFSTFSNPDNDCKGASRNDDAKNYIFANSKNNSRIPFEYDLIAQSWISSAPKSMPKTGNGNEAPLFANMDCGKRTDDDSYIKMSSRRSEDSFEDEYTARKTTNESSCQEGRVAQRHLAPNPLLEVRRDLFSNPSNDRLHNGRFQKMPFGTSDSGAHWANHETSDRHAPPLLPKLSRPLNDEIDRACCDTGNSLPSEPPSIPEDGMGLSSNCSKNDASRDASNNEHEGSIVKDGKDQSCLLHTSTPKSEKCNGGDDENDDHADADSQGASFQAIVDPNDEAEESPFLWMTSIANGSPTSYHVPQEITLDDDQRGSIQDENLTGDGEQEDPREIFFRPPTLLQQRPKTLRSDDRQLTPQSWQSPLTIRPQSVLRTISGGSSKHPLTPCSKRSRQSEKYYHSYETNPSAASTPVPAFVVVHSSGSALVKVTNKVTSEIPSNGTLKEYGTNSSERRTCGCPSIDENAKSWCWKWGRPLMIAIASSILALALITVVTSLVADRLDQDTSPQIKIISKESDTAKPKRDTPTFEPFESLSAFPTSMPQKSPMSDADGLVLDAIETGDAIDSDEKDSNVTSIGPMWEGVVKRPHEEASDVTTSKPTPPPRTLPPVTRIPVPTSAPTNLPRNFPSFVPSNGIPSETTFAPSEDKIDRTVPWNNYVIGLLSVESPSTFTKLNDPTSPQFLALEWISVDATRRDGANAFSMDSSLQRYALATLYFSLGGRGWINKDNWLSTFVDECDWYGVTCDDIRGTIISLELVNNNMMGKLPQELRLLKHLRTLNLRENAIDGILHPTYSHLKDLLEFNLSNNDLTGSIPWEYGGFGSFNFLETFDVSGNRLVGSLPPEFDQLSNLKTLKLCSNQLTGTIPPSISVLTTLQTFKIGGNLLTGSLLDSFCELKVLGSLTEVSTDCNIICRCCTRCCSRSSAHANKCC